jgi:putative sugar O-methyltransferase
METLIDSIHRKIQGWTVRPSPLQPPTSAEQQLIEELRRDVSEIDHKIQDCCEFWRDSQRLLIQNIMRNDPRNFTNWGLINPAMFHNSQRTEFMSLRTSGNWPTWEKWLQEDRTGNPLPYYLLKSSSGNLIHHAYSLHQLLQATGLQPTSIKTVFEFGGGYGSFCRLMKKSGFTGHYIIYDLPVFCLLQRYFLRSIFPQIDIALNKENSKEITLFWKEDEMKKYLSNLDEVALFIATWSLSETPFELRERMLRLTARPQVFFFAYHGTFKSYNNIEYFRRFQQDRPEYRWINFEIPHLKDNYYLIGVREEKAPVN